MKKIPPLQKLKSLCYVTVGGAVAYQFIYFKKDFRGYYDQYIQPISQFLNPELAHKVGVAAIKYGLFPTEQTEDPKVLSQHTRLEVTTEEGGTSTTPC